jgi:glycine/D-amino acid oxidase-like deaminating enzyme/nitrite reductase/ring-hydroxylating ferredoxin subunit
MTSKSLWMEICVAPDARPLFANERCDVVIVGAGIAGLSTAYELAQRKLSVVVIDRGRMAGGMTARTTAHLAPQCDDGMTELKKLRGVDAARLFHESHAAAIDRIEEIQETENIACDFRRLDGYLFSNSATAEIVDREMEVMHEIGAPGERLLGVPLVASSGRPALRYPRQGTFHPLKYLAGVADACTKLGVRFYCETAVLDIREEADTVAVKTTRGLISAGRAVVTTNSPIVDRFALHTKMAPYRTYAMTFAIKRGALPDALYWDTANPYHYVRLQSFDNRTDLVIVGGEDHKSGEANDGIERFKRLEDWIRPLVPELREVRHRWSGQVLETIDYAGFIGRNPGNQFIFISTGDSGQGMTHGVAGSMLNAELIVNGRHRWQEVYAPDRKPLAGAINYIKENVTALKNIAEYLGPAELSAVRELRPGEGAVIRHGLKKIAAYRERSGRLLLHSAACTHVGCHLHWNGFEACWDCPCHGSIFDIDGQPLNAPAVTELEPVNDDELQSAPVAL